MKYMVSLNRVVGGGVWIDADSPEEAEQKAINREYNEADIIEDDADEYMSDCWEVGEVLYDETGKEYI